ncbi:hypothetical protein SynPROS91_02335 [Synechococcus sp. PROS-9-1]|nr:hypothetical protein SynPROS91_02335 [Synechococcus sp. PROS-9-1]
MVSQEVFFEKPEILPDVAVLGGSRFFVFGLGRSYPPRPKC